MDVSRKVIIALGALSLILLTGTFGYYFIEPDWNLLDSFYMTVITISTVGFREIQPLHPKGQYLTIFLIASGLTVGAFAVTNLTSYLVGGQIMQTLRGRRMEKRIQSLRGHIIVAGYGKLGREIAEELEEAVANFVILENDEDHFLAAQDKGYLVVRGDASDEETLERAGVANAKALVTALTGDAGNVMVTITAREMNPNIYIVARGIDDASQKKLKRAGADRVEMPFKISGRRLTTLVLKPGFVDFMDLFSRTFAADMHMEQSIVAEDSNLVGMSLAELNLRQKTGGLSIMAIERANGRIIVNPDGNVRLSGKDRILVLGDTSQLERYHKEYGLKG